MSLVCRVADQLPPRRDVPGGSGSGPIGALTGNAVNDFPAGKRGVGNVAAVARPRVHPE